MDKDERHRRAEQIGDRIRLGNLDVAAIADSSGVDPRTIQTYADGSVQRPKGETVRRLMKAVGLRPDSPLESEAEALDVIRGLLATLSPEEQGPLIGRLMEESVRFIIEKSSADVVQFPTASQRRNRPRMSDRRGSVADAAIDADEGDELAGESEQRGL